MTNVRLVLSPHPSCGKRGELVDIRNEDGGLPWASVHIDTFHMPGVPQGDNALYQKLYYDKETVLVELSIVEKEQAQ